MRLTDRIERLERIKRPCCVFVAYPDTDLTDFRSSRERRDALIFVSNVHMDGTRKINSEAHIEKRLRDGRGTIADHRLSLRGLFVCDSSVRRKGLDSQ